MDSQYEIHFVRAGHKEVVRVCARSMSHQRALGIALMHVGACYGQLGVDADLMALAERLSVSQVRWNRASHTMSFAERSSRQAVKLWDSQGSQ
ncbi:hypothetical protein I5S53_05395 [Pseudomonas juntendi]|uniref:Uncharacterized protein n=1 Tax=Pseudomonas juntendi TaxID=2666183 RepID=A0A7W2QAL2_9PSED|nr:MULTISPECIES: hypothetical protein [Pseudomonas]MBA6098980.1 hypothetical protein [Pseudomonas juntendi]MBH3383413.1 hypothetical protein [Pseudomonas juntendi]